MTHSTDVSLKTAVAKTLRGAVKIALFLVIFGDIDSSAVAGMLERESVSEMVQRAEVIVRGKVVSAECQWKEDSRGRHIYTSVGVAVLDKIKGDVKDDALSFEVVGGRVGDIVEVVSDSAVFTVDEDAIVFLGGRPLTVRRGIDGKVPIRGGRIFREDSEITADSFIQTVKRIGREPGAMASLEEKYEVLQAEARAAQCYLDSGVSWPGSSPSVNFKINENTSDCTGEGLAVRAAANTWNDVGANFTFVYVGTHSQTSSTQNFVNEIMWGSTSGSVATTYYWYYAGGEMIECDIVYNDPSYNWSTSPSSSQMDVQSVGLHEFGHWLSLDDLYDSGDSANVMYGYIYTGQIKRALQICDIQGICYIYGGCPTIRECDECEPEDAYLGSIGTTVWGYSVSGNCGNYGKWVGQFTGQAGATYHFDLCPDSPGSGTNSGFDPDIKITNSSCSILAGYDGVCTSPFFSPNNYQWTCSSSGTYYVIIAPFRSYDSHYCIGDAGDTFTLYYYKEAEDTTPPSPDPMTWNTEPYAASTSSISMVATTATDSTTPIYYLFDFYDSPTGGTGGTDSSWQTSTTYTDSGLQANHQYRYRVRAKDSAAGENATGYSAISSAYTLANAPGAASFSDVTEGSIRANWTANGNPGGTQYLCENITEVTNSGWTTNTYWEEGGLDCDTEYCYRVRARNGDWIDTAWTSLGCQSTQPCPYVSISASAGMNGTVEPNGVFDVDIGQDAAFTAEPDIGYAVDRWYLDGNSVQEGDRSYTLYNVQAEHDVLVTFMGVLPMDLDGDGVLDFVDYAIFAFYWMDDTCMDPDWCKDSDSDGSGGVDSVDLFNFANYWLWCRSDLNLDDAVDFTDYAIFAGRWMDDTCVYPDWCEGTDFDESGVVDASDFAQFVEYWLRGTGH